MKDIRVPKTLIDHGGAKWNLKDFEPNEKASLTYKLEGEPAGLLMAPHLVETNFTRKGRPEPESTIVVQGRYECAAASLAMLLGEKLFFVKRAMGKMNWRNDDSGAHDEVMIGAARLLGRDLIKLNAKEVNKGIGPCSVTVPSINIKGMFHAVTWNGKEILDPNWGREGRKFWGTEWAPWTMKARGALVLLDRVLTQAERDELDKAMRQREEKEIHAIKMEVLKALKEAS
jgi:hypothetical protein